MRVDQRCCTLVLLSMFDDWQGGLGVFATVEGLEIGAVSFVALAVGFGGIAGF